MIYFYIAVFILIIAVAAVALLGKSSQASSAVDGASFSPREILSPAELKFYLFLQTVLPQNYTVLCKLGLWAIVKNDQRSGWAKIAQKHLDFVIVRADTFQTALAIELDDKSHNSASAQKRDTDKSAILQSAAIPLVRIPVKKDYDAQKISAILSPYLN